MNLKEIESYFRGKLLARGNTAEGMDWKNQDTQYLRFERVVNFIRFEDSPSILDVGSGTSEFLQYCRNRNLNCKYSGIDIVPEMVQTANQRFGEDVAKMADVLTMPQNDKYDYVIASGTYNAKLQTSAQDWETFFYNNLKAMYELSQKAVVFNCMTQFVDWEYDHLYYPNLERLSSFIVKNLSRRFYIDHSYPLFEMTVCIERT